MTEIILSIVTGIFAGGMPAMILFFRANKRKAMAEAEKAEASNALEIMQEWRELANKREMQLEERDQKIQNLQDKCTELKVWKAQHEYKICELRGCENRTPPTGY